jgi:hypothetical protein
MMHSVCRPRARTEEKPVTSMPDPLDPDLPTDEIVVTSTRGLARLALAAAETAARFARAPHLDVDPMAWLMAPRRLFDGRAALRACLERESCVRTVLLHGLEIGLDADPAEMDDLIDEDTDHEGGGDGGSDEVGNGPPRLWTGYLVVEHGGERLHAFDAVVAATRMEAERRLRVRHGPEVADGLDLVEGFDPSLPLAEALLSPAVADMLEQVAEDPASPLAHGLSVSVEQRFSA